MALRHWRSIHPSQPEAGGRLTLTAARQTLVGTQNELAMLKLRLAKGELIDARRAKRDSFECARATRDSVLNVSGRMAAELAAESDPARVRARLDEELRGALSALADILGRGTEQEA